MATDFLIGQNFTPTQLHDAEVLLGNEYVILPPSATIFDILVHIGVFKSKNQASKNWNKEREIPMGFSELHRLGHLRQSVYIFKVPEWASEAEEKAFWDALDAECERMENASHQGNDC